MKSNRLLMDAEAPISAAQRRQQKRSLVKHLKKRTKYAQEYYDDIGQAADSLIDDGVPTGKALNALCGNSSREEFVKYFGDLQLSAPLAQAVYDESTTLRHYTGAGKRRHGAGAVSEAADQPDRKAARVEGM